MANLEILTDINVVMPDNPALEFNFNCDPFQINAFNAIERGNHILVTAPTSSGKTLCAEYAIAHHIRQKNRIIYTSPIKSLSNEKYKDFKENKPNISIGLLTGDNKINPDADCLIVTAEILRNALYKPTETNIINQNKPLLEDVKCVIMDEVHFINDKDRGKIWEETIILLDDNIQLIMLSATINKSEEFATWISNIKKSKVSLIPSTNRIVPLEHYFYVDDELHKILDNKDNFFEDTYFSTKKIYDKIKKEEGNRIDYTQINKLIKYLNKHNLLQAIFFSFSRKKCEDFSHQLQDYLLDAEEQREVIREFDYYLRPYIKIYENMPQYITIKKLLVRGVCFHHSGLIPIFKEVIEILFKKSLIKVLFATETFAVGVNMPTRTIIFTELMKTTNENRRFLNTAEYKQMSGRAGRRGLDKKGTVIILPLYEYPNLLDLKNVMVKTMPHIDSKFKVDYDFCLKTLLSKKVETFELFNKSLRNNEHNKFILSINKEISDLQQEIKINKFNEYSNFELNCSKLYNLEFNKNSIDGIIIKVNQKTKKEISQLRNLIKPEIYECYKNYVGLNNKLKELVDNEKYYVNFINETTERLYKILIENKLVNYNTIYELTPKGICTAMISECNGIIISELIFSGLLDNLTTKEIIALMSIFLTAPKVYDEIYISRNLKEVYSKIQEIVKYYEEQNRYNNIYIDEEYWQITNTYIDLVMDWINDKPKEVILQELYEMEEYEGSFVRNMLKLYNILTNLKNVAQVINKIDLVQKLENIDSLILKDIVNINSLYLL